MLQVEIPKNYDRGAFRVKYSISEADQTLLARFINPSMPFEIPIFKGGYFLAENDYKIPVPQKETDTVLVKGIFKEGEWLADLYLSGGLGDQEMRMARLGAEAKLHESVEKFLAHVRAL